MFDSSANLNKEILIDNFRFMKTFYLLLKWMVNTFMTSCARGYMRSHMQKQMKTLLCIEVTATAILRCYDKYAIEELYLVNWLHLMIQVLDCGKDI